MSPVLLPAYLINNQAVLRGTMMHNHQGFCDITVLARCVAGLLIATSRWRLGIAVHCPDPPSCIPPSHSGIPDARL